MIYANQYITFTTGLDEYEIAQSNHHEQLKAAYSELENKQNTLEMRTIDLVEQKKKVTQNYFKDEALYKELQDTKCALDRKEIQYLELQTQRRGDIHDHEDKKTLGDYLLNVFIMSLIVYYLVALVNVDLPHTVRGIFNFNN